VAGTSFDVAIVGAGPAGAVAAWRLAQAGARVAILDASHPREKPCGGGVTARALSLVADSSGAMHGPSVTIRTATFMDSRTQAAAHVDLDLPTGSPRLTVASRASFDAQLLDAARRAGAMVIPTRVRSVARRARGFLLVTASGSQITVPFLVGADGANSLVRRRLLVPFRRDQLSIATGFFAHGSTSEAIVLEFMGDPPGYIWSFPRPDHLAIGICAQADRGVGSGELRARAADWIRATNVAPGARLEPYAWPIPSLSTADFDALAVAGHGWCLVGDAAGLVDPITREGIFFALQSGAFAAECFARDPARAAETYTARVRDEIASELSRAARLKAGFFSPPFTALLMEALLTSAPIRRVVADLVSGTQTYRGLKWRLARTLEVGLAMRALRTYRAK
jgi:geranylgeranyl reductase family protein